MFEEIGKGRGKDLKKARQICRARRSNDLRS